MEEKEKTNKKIVEWVIGGLSGLILANLGIQEMIKPTQYTGVITLVIAFVLVYFSFHIYQIKNNEKEIKELKEDNKKIKDKAENQEKLLNTLRDIVILKKMRNKKGQAIDILEILKIIIIVIVGYIIIKALLEVAK